MAKPLIPTTELVKSVSLKISGATPSDFQGKTLRVTIPCNNLAFDHHSPTQEAYFYTIFPVQFGNGTTPAPAGVRLVSQETFLFGNDSDDIRKSVVSRVILTFEFESDASAFEDIPLII